MIGTKRRMEGGRRLVIEEGQRRAGRGRGVLRNGRRRGGQRKGLGRERGAIREGTKERRTKMIGKKRGD